MNGFVQGGCFFVVGNPREDVFFFLEALKSCRAKELRLMDVHPSKSGTVGFDSCTYRKYCLFLKVIPAP